MRNVNWRSVFSNSPLSDLESLERYCELAPHYKLAIEIGSYEGGSTAVISQFFNSVIAIDPWGEHDVKPGDSIATFTPGTAGTNFHFPNFNRNMHQLGLCDIVTPLIGTVKVLENFPYLNAGLAFVDDGHTYNDCLRDINAVYPHICEGGLVICHDYYNEFGGPCGAYIGVTEAVNESIKTYKLNVINHSGGIICLKKRSSHE